MLGMGIVDVLRTFKLGVAVVIQGTRRMNRVKIGSLCANSASGIIAIVVEAS